MTDLFRYSVRSCENSERRAQERIGRQAIESGLLASASTGSWPQKRHACLGQAGAIGTGLETTTTTPPRR